MEVHLNASALSDPDALYLLLNSVDFPHSVSDVPTLVDSGSSHCFVDSKFAHNYLQPYSVPPIRLRLLDGTSNSVITEAVHLSILLPSGDVTPFEFYLTRLDSTCSMVLGHNWLFHFNPSIDWKLSSVTLRSIITNVSGTTTSSTAAAASALPPAPQSPNITPSAPSAPPDTTSAPPSISLVNAAAFVRASKLEGSQVFQISLSDPSVTGKASSVTSDPPIDMSSVPQEYHDYADVFSKKKADTLAPHRPYDLKIELEDDGKPPFGPIYSVSPSELSALREFIDEHINIGFIRPSRSPHGAPVLFVRKKDGSLRLCVDFRALNKITKRDRYPIPLLSDLLDAPRKARFYTKIDLRHAYHLVRIAEGDEWKTAFRTRYGSFEWMVMPFGLTNAPAAFQRFMNDVFSDLLDVCVIVYLDDILIYSKNLADHRKHVREVLRRLRKHGLFARADKCEWHKDTVEYLGYILSPTGLTMADDKIKTILDWPEPRRVKDVQSFLGFANFYRRFIDRYSEITVPLTHLTRKDTPWNFTPECRSAFETLKKAFTTAPVLTHYRPGAQLVVETDASDYALAAILSIHTDDGELHPIAFHSRTFTAPELNYDVHDKELLAIFEAFRSWRHYLEGAPKTVDVVTDHKNLVYFSTTKILTRRQARWSEFLSQFNLSIRFRPGKLGAKPDALTRRWDVYPKEGSSDYAAVNPHNLRPIFTDSQIILTGEQLASSLRATILMQPALRASVVVDVDTLHEDIREANTIIPPPIPDSDSDSETTSTRWSKDDDGLVRLDGRIYVPDHNDLRLRVLRYKHDHILSGHPGQNKTIELVRQEYTWPGMRDYIKHYCKSCTTCMRAKPQRHKPYGTLQQLPIPPRPWESISMDFIETLPTSGEFNSILVVVDRFSKQSIFIPTTNKCTSEDLAQLFVIHVFSKHGVPSHVTSDRGSEFVSRFFRSLGAALGMDLHFTSGYHPEADGQTERINQILEQYLRIYCGYQQDDWHLLLPLAEFCYNNTPHSSTGVSPFFANKGYHPSLTVNTDLELASARARNYVTNLDALHSSLRDNLAEAQKRYQGPADARRKTPPKLRIGDQVFVKAHFIKTTRPSKKLSEKYLGPFPIVAQAGPQSYSLQLSDSLRRIHPVFHISVLEPYTPNTIPNRIPEPPPPIEIDGEEEFEIHSIVDSRVRARRKCPLQYRVRWLGYEGHPDEFEWLPADELAHAQELVQEFHRAHPDKPGPDV